MNYDVDIDKPIPRRGPGRFCVTYLRWSCEIVPMNVRDSLRFPGYVRYRIVAQKAFNAFGDVYNVGRYIHASFIANDKFTLRDMNRIVSQIEEVVSVGEPL